jgi:putative nucleotidyltransferase with HDIG domain
MKRPPADEAQARRPRQQRVTDTPLKSHIRALLFALLVFVSWGVSFALYSSPDQVRVVVGEPSQYPIKAPRQLTYISEVKTQEARLLAASQVQDVYRGPDMQVANQQLQKAQDIMAYISAIRYDEYTDQEQKIALIEEIPDLMLPAQTAPMILELDERVWEQVITETLRVVDLAMRDEIRDYQLADARRGVPRITTHALSYVQRELVNRISPGLIVPNTFYDDEQTQANYEAARNAVEPVHWTIREGESILREGEIVTELAYEKLKVLGLLDVENQWQDIASFSLFALLIVASFSLYIAKSQPLLLFRPRRSFLLALTMIIAGVGARLSIPGHTLIPYLFPTACVAMLITILLDGQLGVTAGALVAILVGFNAGGSIELVIYAFIGSLVGSLAVWRMDNLGAFARAGVYIALANVAAVTAFHMGNKAYDPVSLLQLAGMGVLNAALSASLTFVAFSVIGRLFGITTSLQLLELARPTHPLFRQLLIESPGTYHHSIVTSNLAERAAEAIGADALLARVGSYYHDIGKISRPYFFAENQNDGENPHDKLDPKTSVEIIIAHTLDGVELARKYRLPDKITDFISEHHGTTLVTYFYRRASQESDGNGIREEDFRYPGPRPQSRETAIVMLADSIEASVRANRPATQAEMERIVRQIINDRLVGGQLDECDLTLKDLDKIRKAFVSILQGVYHPRIQYPEKAKGRARHSASTAP